MWIKRGIDESLLRLAQQRPAVVLTGARQTGKTSLLKKLFPGHRWVSLDLPATADEAERNPGSFLARFPTPLVIDEVQYAPQLFRHLKAAIDSRRSVNGQFILTGSQKFTLMQGVTDSLAGRAGLLELETLSLREIHDTPALSAQPSEEVLFRGGFPELYENPELLPGEFYRAYVASYLERDVRSLLRVGKLRDFERFVRACALRSGQILNQSELARDVGISPSTAGEWISVLEASNQVTLLEPWFSNGQKRMTKSPKLYFNDTGLLCFLVGISRVEELVVSPLRGALWETFVFSELRKRMKVSGGAGNLFFYRDRAREADFLIHKGGHFVLMDAKWSEHPGSEDAASLLEIGRTLGEERILSRTLICRAAHAFPVLTRPEVGAVPLSELSIG